MAPGLSSLRSNAQSRSRSLANSSTSRPSSSTASAGESEKSGRKRAANKALHDLILRGGPKPRIEIPYGKTRPLCEWSSQWMTEIGIIVRRDAPLTTHTWAEVKPEQKETLYELLLETFDMDLDQPHVKKVVDDIMRDRFREFRHDLHHHYLSIPNGYDKTEHPLGYIAQESWESLCVWFESDDFKKRSVANKANRHKLKWKHRGGSKPFVKHRYEQKNPETNEEPTRPEFFKSMHHNIS